MKKSPEKSPRFTEQKALLVEKIQELDNKITTSFDFIQKYKLTKELEELESYEINSESEEIEKFKTRLIQEGYQETHGGFEKDFTNYTIYVTLEQTDSCYDYSIAVFDKNIAIEAYAEDYESFSEFKEAFDNLNIEEQLFNIQIAIPHISVNKHSVVETAHQLFSYCDFTNEYNLLEYMTKFEKINYEGKYI